MKIKNSDFHQLQKALLETISPTAREKYRAMGFTEERYLWDCFWHVADAGLISPEKLYDYLNDSHIETALKKILIA